MILYPVGYNTPPSRVTLEQLNKRADWAVLDPEFRRRLLAMFDASNGTVGIGGGGRTTAQQRDLFLSRYVVSATGSTTWDGKRWAKKAGVASAAPPGSSYHEASTPAGHALAADLIGDLTWVGLRARSFGLHDFSDVNSEPWHVQPVEIPNSRSKYTGAPLPIWALSAPTPVPPTPAQIEDDDMPPIGVNKEWYGGDGGDAGRVHFEFLRDHAGKLRYLVLPDYEWRAFGSPVGVETSNDDLLKMGAWQPAPTAAAAAGKLTVVSTVSSG